MRPYTTDIHTDFGDGLRRSLRDGRGYASSGYPNKKADRPCKKEARRRWKNAHRLNPETY